MKSSTSRKQGIKGLLPLSPAPQIPAEAPALRSGQFRLTIPNTYLTISTPASLRSDCCSPSSGMPFGFPAESAFTFTGIPTWEASEQVWQFCRAFLPPRQTATGCSSASTVGAFRLTRFHVYDYLCKTGVQNLCVSSFGDGVTPHDLVPVLLELSVCRFLRFSMPKIAE